MREYAHYPHAEGVATARRLLTPLSDVKDFFSRALRTRPAAAHAPAVPLAGPSRADRSIAHAAPHTHTLARARPPRSSAVLPLR
jgi:hypothetical protein